MTKLCDLGPNDSVCSVQWTREGSYISIGTSHGQVQVCCCLPSNLWLLKVLFGCIEVAKGLILLAGLGRNTVQESPNHGRSSDENWCLGMELKDLIIREQRQKHPST